MNTRKLFLLFFNAYLVIFTIFCAFFTLTPGLFWFFLPIRQKTYLNGKCWGLFGRLMLKWGCFAKVDITDQRECPRDEFLKIPQLYIANHQSLLDIPLTLTTFQIPPIMKQQVLYIPIIGLMGWAAGSLIVNRGSKGSRKRVLDQVRHRLTQEKFSIQYYPEGTRNKKSRSPKDYQEIKKPIMLLAYQENIPLFPVSLDGTYLINRKGGLFYPFQRVSMLLHPPLYPQDFDNEEEFAQAAWDQVHKGCRQLQGNVSAKKPVEVMA